jgi:hypothetical protein
VGCSEGDACRECSFRDVLTGAGQDCGCHEISCGLAGPWQSRLAVGWLHVEPLHTSVGIFLHFKHPCANYFLLSNGVGRPCLEVRRCDSQKHPVTIFRCRGALVRTAYEACLRYVLSTNSSASVKPPETRTGTPFGHGGGHTTGHAAHAIGRLYGSPITTHCTTLDSSRKVTAT